MPANREFILKLRGLILDGFKATEFDQFLRLECDKVREQISPDRPFPELVFEVITKADRDGWLPQLCKQLAGQHANPDIRARSAELIKEIYIEGRPIPQLEPEDQLVVGSKPYVDRISLRKLLKMLFRDSSANVLLIEGPTRAGKSHSWELIRDASRSRGWFPLYADFKPFQIPGTCDERKIIAMFTDQIGLKFNDFDGDKEKQQESYAKSLCERLIGLLGRNPDRLLLMIDGFDQPGITVNARILLKELVTVFGLGRIQYAKLVLTCIEPYDLPAGFRILRETIPPIGQQDIVEYILALVSRHKERDMEQDDVQKLAERICQDENSSSVMWEKLQIVVDELMGFQV